MKRIRLIAGDVQLERYVGHLLNLAGLRVSYREPPDLLVLLEPTEISFSVLEGLVQELPATLPVLCIGSKALGAELASFQEVSFLKRPFRVEDFFNELEKGLGRSLLLNSEERTRPFLGEDEKIAALRQRIPFLAEVAKPILLEGEAGTGKEHFARHIHARVGGPFVKFAARALPEEMQEALLFGFVAGVFDGISRGKDGALERARSGVLYLEGLEYLTPACQQKLLYYLETGSYFPMGSREALSPTVKLLISARVPPGDLLKAGKLLPSLYFRLAEFSVYLPPLRRRFIDLPLLVEYFLEKYALLYRQPYRAPSERLFERLLLYPWPHNIAELELIVKDLIIFGEEKILKEIIIRQEEEVVRLSQLEASLDQRFSQVFSKKRKARTRIKDRRFGSSRKSPGGPHTGSR